MRWLNSVPTFFAGHIHSALGNPRHNRGQRGFLLRAVGSFLHFRHDFSFLAEFGLHIWESSG